MKTRFYLTASGNVPAARRQMLRVGLPEEKYMVPNLCLCAEGSYDCIELNLYALREALLRNPDYTKNLLGIEVKDATIKKKEPVKAEPKAKKEVTK